MIASVDVDPQKTFTPLCPNELPVHGGHLIANALNQQAKKANLRILTKDAHSPSAIWRVGSPEKMGKALTFKNADLTWVDHAIIGTEGFQILSELPQITDYDFVVWKGIEPDLHPYGACFHDLNNKLSTGLIEWLQIRQVTTVIVGGLATEYCVKTTALQLKQQGLFDVWVNLEACRGLNENDCEHAIDEMQTMGIHVIKSSEHFTPK